jgi:hypothetical protein
MVDQKTQRAVWKFADGKNPEVLMDTRPGSQDTPMDSRRHDRHLAADRVDGGRPILHVPLRLEESAPKVPTAGIGRNAGVTCDG